MKVGEDCALRGWLMGVLFILGALVASPGFAQAVFDTPKALLEHAYQPYATGDFSEDVTQLYSRDLRELFAEAQARGNEDEVGPVDFDVFVNGQDYQLTDLVIADPEISGDTATEAVTFRNFNEPQSLKFYLVRQEDGWRIDDIESLLPTDGWRLSALLADDPALN